MKEIGNNEIKEYGISVKHHVMDNGELRFRLIGSDGSAYVRTEASKNSGWQNSHYHTTIRELYLIQRGWIIFVELINDKLVTKKYLPDEYCFSHPGVPHNVYMAPNTILHSIKFGDCKKTDWEKSEELDEKINYINVNSI